MTTEILVTELERKGVRLVAQGQNLKLQAPADRVPSAKTIAELREKRAAILEYLRERKQAPATQFSSFPTPIACKTEKLGDWHPKSLDAERRVGQPNAKLFPFIGRKVRTPGGPGTLLQVFAERVTVLLDSELSRCSFFRPTEIEPVSSGP